MELRSGVPSRSKKDDIKNSSKRSELRNDSPRKGVSKQEKSESESTLIDIKALNQQELYPHRYLLRNNNSKEGNDQLFHSPLTISPKKSKKRKNNNLESSSLAKSVTNSSPKKKKHNTKKRNLAVKMSLKSNKSCSSLDSRGIQGSKKNQASNSLEKNDKAQCFTEKENNSSEDFRKDTFYGRLEDCIASRGESSSKDTDSLKDEYEDSDSLSTEKTSLMNYEAALKSQLSFSENPLRYTQEDSYLDTSQRIAEALTILNSKNDPVIQRLVLQNLAECLSVASEDTMSSCSGKRALIAALVQILESDSTPQASDTSVSYYGGDDSAENMTLACRCLCNLMESFPPIIEAIVKSGAINILIIQLEGIKSIELAEQIVVALKIVSYDFSTIIVRSNGLTALLRHVDFYSTQVQRNSVTAVANCCKSLESIYFDKVLEILPFIQNILNFPDIVVQEYVCLIFANITKSFCLYPNKLELLFSEDVIESFLKLSKPLNNLKMDVKCHLNLIGLLNIVASNSDVIAVKLLKKNIINILYHNIFGEFSSDQIPSSYVLSLSEVVEATLELSNNLLPELSNYEIHHSDNAMDSLSYADFCSVMAPVALKLFKVSNAIPTKLHCLTFIYKISVFFDNNSLKSVFSNLSIGGFLSSTIFNQENILLLRSLQIVNCLIVKLPDEYIPIFSREGIFNELSELSKKLEKITKTVLDKSHVYPEVYNFCLKNQQIKLEKLNSLIDENFKQLLKTSSSSAVLELKTYGEQLINPLVKIINSTYSKSPNYIKCKSRNPVTIKLKSAVRDLFIDNARSKLEKSLVSLRDILFQNDLTTSELSSSKLIHYLQNFLCSKDGIFNEEAKKIFCDIFLNSAEGLASLKNLVSLLQSRIDSLEDYEIVALRKEPIFMRCFIQASKIVLYQDKTPSHAPHLLEMQLHEPTKLLVNHIMATLKEETSLRNPNERDKYDIQLKYKDIVLNKDGTLLKSLLQCGITAENIIQNAISLNYSKVTKEEEDSVNVPEKNQGHVLKEFEIIFRLLRSIYYLREQSLKDSCEAHKTLPSELFINVKLTAKLDSQLNEDLVVACECLPEWCGVLVNKFPFLFPTAVKLHLLQTSSYGADRLLTKIRDSNNTRQQERPLTSSNVLKSKILVSRHHLLKAAVKLFESYSHNRSVLEIQFQDEVGSGQGPTLEFFSCIFQEFCRQDLGLWRHQDSPASNKYVYTASGLFPRPRIESELNKSAGKKILLYFKTLGWITAKSLMDGRVVDIPLNKLFLELAIFKIEKRSLSQADSLRMISLIDSSLANSLRCICASRENDSLLKEMHMTFVLPGYDVQLEEKGSKTFVTASNVDKFLERVFDLTIGRGIQYALNAFEQGFNCIFPLKNLQVFTLDELDTILGSNEEDWSAETIRSAMKADHGFSIPSISISRLISILTNFTSDQRGLFLKFITGSRKLPIGGFHSLNPNLTVVKKFCDSSLTPDDYLPSVNTCFNYLKLPEYSSEKVMKERLLTAINEGKDSFHLS